MPAKEQQDRSLSELVVKEAVGAGMNTPMREPILEAVEESGEGRSAARQLPIVGAALGIGAGVGYLLGTQHQDALAIGPITPTPGESDLVEETLESVEPTTETIEEEEGAERGSRRLPRIVLGLAIAAGIALLRRRMQSGETEEWEPIEEFDTSVGGDEDESDEAEASEETESTEEEETTDGESEEAET